VSAHGCTSCSTCGRCTICGGCSHAGGDRHFTASPPAKEAAALFDVAPIDVQDAVLQLLRKFKSRLETGSQR
jgi:hypothetical protein